MEGNFLGGTKNTKKVVHFECGSTQGNLPTTLLLYFTTVWSLAALGRQARYTVEDPRTSWSRDLPIDNVQHQNLTHIVTSLVIRKPLNGSFMLDVVYC